MASFSMSMRSQSLSPLAQALSCAVMDSLTTSMELTIEVDCDDASWRMKEFGIFGHSSRTVHLPDWTWNLTFTPARHQRHR